MEDGGVEVRLGVGEGVNVGTGVDTTIDVGVRVGVPPAAHAAPIGATTANRPVTSHPLMSLQLILA